MPGLALTVANPLIVVTVPADWDDAGEHNNGRKSNFGHRQRFSTSVSIAVPSWTARIRSSWAPQLEQQPDESGQSLMKEKVQ
jgi:hypothetical protein